MDAVAAVGGPILGAVEKENRVKGLCNVVLSQREPEMSPKTGKPKKHHSTRSNLKRALDSAARLAGSYTPEVAARATEVAKRALEHPLVAHQKAAKHSRPEHRQGYDAKSSGVALVVPRAGGYVKESTDS